MVLAQHMSNSPCYPTPSWIVEGARHVMGSIDLDPCSSAEFNQSVRATKYYTEEDDGLKQRWNGNVFCNPPGGRRGLVRKFWDRAIHSEAVVFWVGFNIGQLGTLTKARMHPLDFYTMIPFKRVDYGGGNPSHHSYLTLVTYDEAAEDRFADWAEQHGRLFVPS